MLIKISRGEMTLGSVAKRLLTLHVLHKGCQLVQLFLLLSQLCLFDLLSQVACMLLILKYFELLAELVGWGPVPSHVLWYLVLVQFDCLDSLSW